MKVQPFSNIPHQIKKYRHKKGLPKIPVLLMNMDVIDHMENNSYRYTMTGPCDDSVKWICEQLGWTDDLQKAMI